MSIVRTIVAFAFGLLLPAVAAAQTANLWIDTNGGTCTRQSTAGSYVDAQACASMQAALAACTAGDTIRMKAGTYGAQTITATKTSPGCTIIAESNTFLSGNLTTHGAWYEIQNVSGSASGVGWYITSSANNITCRNCSWQGVNTSLGYQDAAVYWGGTAMSNIRWIGGSLTNFACSSCAKALAVYEGTNFLVDGITFDNIQNTGGGGNHFEAIRIDGNVNGLTLSRSTFTNIEATSSTIFLSTFTGAKPQNLVFENNFFSGSGSVSFYVFNANFQNGSTCANWSFRYNTFNNLGNDGIMSDPVSMSCSGGTVTNVEWLGNLMPRGDCPSGTKRYNVGYGSSGAACTGTGNTVISSASFDTDGFHLTSGSAAIGAGGTGADCIAVDHDNNTRTSPCDAGAHEFGAGSATPDAPTNFRLNIDIWTTIALLGLLGGAIWRALNAPDPSRGGRGHRPAAAVCARQVARRQARSLAA